MHDVPGNIHWLCGLASQKNFSQELQRILNTQQELLIKMAPTLGKSISKGFEMPKRDNIFDGNPIIYPGFMENFEASIEEREQDFKARLAYLIQFSSDVAKEAISNSVMLPEYEGYHRAKQILYNSFGQNHIITLAYVDKVRKSCPLKDGES